MRDDDPPGYVELNAALDAVEVAQHRSADALHEQLRRQPAAGLTVLCGDCHKTFHEHRKLVRA